MPAPDLDSIYGGAWIRRGTLVVVTPEGGEVPVRIDAVDAGDLTVAVVVGQVFTP